MKDLFAPRRNRVQEVADWLDQFDDGEVYGLCSSVNCYGRCEPWGSCDCICHDAEAD